MTIEILQHRTSLLKELLNSIHKVEELNKARADFLGKKSLFAEMQKTIPTLPIDEKKALGQQLQAYKIECESMIDSREKLLLKEKLQQALSSARIDFTEPYDNGMQIGAEHPIHRTISELLQIMSHLGFKAVSGPEVEEDFYNFTALNVPPLHPARNSQDTFYVKDSDLLLRTQTSSVQIRYLMKNKPPCAIVSVGRVYRADDIDGTHLPNFHQMECLSLDRSISLLDMKETIRALLELFFMKKNIDLRFRSSYFPFTSPSMEVDIKFNGRWLEIMGCGMVHHKVLKQVNISDNIQGFAFGLGIERVAMIRDGIDDIRHFITNNKAWLEHYNNF